MKATFVVKAGITDKKEYVLEPGRAYFIGRSREADIIVKDQQASRRHCALEATPDGTWTLADQDSSNGTYVNRQRTKTRPLKDGDVVQVGKTTFEVRIEGAPARPSGTDTETILVGPDGAPAAGTTVKQDPAQAGEPDPCPVRAEPRAPAPAPRPDPAPRKAEAAKQEASDADLKDLYAFLDKLDGDRASGGDKPKAKGDGRSVAHEPPPITPPPAEPVKDKDEAGSFLDLLEKAEPIPKDEKPQPPSEGKPDSKGGGLLGFLRRKKKQS